MLADGEQNTEQPGSSEVPVYPAPPEAPVYPPPADTTSDPASADGVLIEPASDDTDKPKRVRSPLVKCCSTACQVLAFASGILLCCGLGLGLPIAECYFGKSKALL